MNTIKKSKNYLNWMKDESFFSICSRQHIFWGNRYLQETLESLFECNVRSYSHDFPRNLGSLNKSALDVWGSADKIIDQHTIASMFFPFQSTEHVVAHKEAMKSNNLGPIKYKLGLITGGFGGEHPLKACSECLIDDRASCGVSYWHLSHQFPGVTICQQHNCLLKESKENRQWSKAFSLCIPSDEILIEAGQAALDDGALASLKKVSCIAIKLGELGGVIRFNPDLVAQAYATALACLGTSRQDKKVAEQAFTSHCLKLRSHPQFKSLPCTDVCSIGLTSQMTRRPRGYCHPLKHLVLISWLFGSLEAFICAYEHQMRSREKMKADTSSQMEFQDEKPYIKSKVVFTTPKFKPKKMDNEAKKIVLDYLESSRSKADVCTKLGISISTVNRILRWNPIAQHKINEMMSTNSRVGYRKQWLSEVSNNPNFGVKKIRGMIPRVYAWLYRNDNIWLAQQNEKLPSGRSGNNSNIDWAIRDESLCFSIEDVVRQKFSNSVRPHKYELYQLIPGLHSALESKSHYHKARALLCELTK